MKKFIGLSNTFRALLFAAIGLASIAMFAQETKSLKVESNHSTVQFSVPISNGITRITGKFNDYAIDIEYVDNDFTKSSISMVIQVASIDTGIPGRDEHLITKDFFEVETYPEITFTSNSIRRLDDGSYMINGLFTMHGVTKTIDVPIKITGKDGEYTLGFSSRLTIKRSDYNVASDFAHTSMENFLGDDIGIEIDFWTKRNKSKKE